MTLRLRWLSLLMFVACGGSTDGGTPPPSPPVVPSRVEVTFSAASVPVAATSQGTARIFDQSGREMVGQSVTWSTSTVDVASVSATGLATALRPGIATIVATTSNGVSGTAVLTVLVPPVVTVVLSRDTATLVPGATLPLVATLIAANGGVITERSATWQSLDPTIASVSTNGVVTAVAIGDVQIVASAETKTATARITVRSAQSPTAPGIASISVPIITAGATITLTGRNFSATRDSNIVRIDGVTATVMAASATALTVTVPSSGFACRPTSNATVEVQVRAELGAREHPLRVATQRTLGVGMSLVLSDAADARCNEFAQTGGRYVVSVYSVATTPTSRSDYVLRGAASTVGTQIAIAAVVSPASGTVPSLGTAMPTARPAAIDASRERRTAQRHDDLLRTNLDFLRRQPNPQGALRASQRLRSSVAQEIGIVGTISALKVPNIGPGNANVCRNPFTVDVRTVYSGTRSIIVEDTVTTYLGAAINTGQMDSLYRRLGQEFDSVMFDVLATNFGNPLRMDDLLDNNGKIIMLFSPRVNSFENVLGYVTSCDFFPVAQAPSSNLAEVFYAVVPTSVAEGFSGDTRSAWYRVVRSTVVHEVKHITSFAERIRGNAQAEVAAFEEGTAQHAEEIWARAAAYNGLQPRSNARYATTLACDVRPASANAPQCAGKPFAVFYHFDALYEFLGSSERLSPLGRSTSGSNDASFYGSNWALLRWAIDHFATNDAAFLGPMTQSPSTVGLPQLQIRTGRPWEESLGEFSLALYLDDAPGFTPINPRLTFPSWNLRDIFAGMNADFGQSFYPRASPLTPTAVSFGTFLRTATLAGGSFSIYDITGAQSGAQLIELRGINDGPAPATVRVAVVRVQ